VYIINN